MLIDLRNIPTVQANKTVDHLMRCVEEPLLFESHPTDQTIGAAEDLMTTPINQALRKIHAGMLAMLVTGATVTKAVSNEDAHHDFTCRELERRVQAAPPGTLSLMDYMAIIECLLRQYLPPAVLADQIKKEAVRGFLTGHLRKQIPDREAKQMVQNIPVSVDLSGKVGAQLSAADLARIVLAQASAGRHVTDLTAAARSRMQNVLLDAEKQRLNLGSRALPAQPLQQALADTFGDLNRDWRRIAVTETAINAADGYLASMKAGAQVQWLSHPGACVYCSSQNGKVFEIVPSDSRKKNPDTQVWVGKQAMNIGRSIAKRKRLEDGTMTDRTVDELIVPAIPVHPTCRCIWTPYVPLSNEQRRRLTAA